jgi:uncharacterized membrane protein
LKASHKRHWYLHNNSDTAGCHTKDCLSVPQRDRFLNSVQYPIVGRQNSRADILTNWTAGNENWTDGNMKDRDIMMNHRQTITSWLARRFFYPLLAISLLALGLMAAWYFTMEEWPGPRLFSNLGLAWIPYLCSLSLVALKQRSRRRRLPRFALFGLWIAFFPNAPYLVTEWLYLPRLHEELWFSIAIFAAFSLCGLQLTAASLYLVHTQVRIRHGRGVGWAFVIIAMLLSGLGVYLGRFLRLNSWDLVVRPITVLNDTVRMFEEPERQIAPAAFCVVFTTFLLLYYIVFLQFRHAPWSEEEETAWRSRQTAVIVGGKRQFLGGQIRRDF